MSDVKNFCDTLEQIRYGELIKELSRELNALTRACSETGKAGTMSLTLKLKPGKSGQIELADTVVVKAPEFERGSTLMFATPEFNLQREDPRQLRIDELRTISIENNPTNLRQVN